MKRKGWIAIASVGFLLCAGILIFHFLGYFPGRDKSGSVEEALSKALHSYENWSTFQGEAQMVQYNAGGNPVTDLIAVKIAQPLKVNVSFKASDDPAKVGLAIISDGEKIYAINPASPAYTENHIPGFATNLDVIPHTLADIKPDETYNHPLVLLISNPIMEYVFPVGFAQGFARFEYQFLGEETVAGRRTWKIQFQTETTTCLAWIDQATGVILKYSQETGGKKVVEMEFLSVEFDGDIDPSVFSPPPAGSAPSPAPPDTFTATPLTLMSFPLPQAVPLAAFQEPVLEAMESKQLEAEGWTSYIGPDWPTIFQQTGEYPIVSSLVQAQDGTLWFVTKGGESSDSARGVGIYHYDGENWTHYSEGHGAPSNAFTLVAAAPDGSIWLAMEPAGLARFDGQSWTVYTAENGLPGEWIQSMAFAPDGALWVGTNDRVAGRFDGGLWQYFTSQDGLWGDFVGGIFVLPDGSLLFSSSNDSSARLTRFDGQHWEDYPTQWTETGKYTTGMAVAPNGDLWFATEFSGAYRLSANTWTNFDLMNGSLMSGIAVAPDGSAWVGTAGGVARFDGTDWTTFQLEGNTGLNWAGSIVAATDGSIWLAYHGGIAHYVPSDYP